jgi:hypothetical protein
VFVMTSPNWKGIPSKHAMYFPEKGGRKFGQKIWENGFRWNISDLMEFLFPTSRMPRHHEVAVEYLKFLLEIGDNTEEGKREFCEKTGYSLNTLRKQIIPKLYRFGLISRTRQFPKTTAWNIKSKRKSYEQESLYFSTMLRKMASEWEVIVKTSRSKRQILENMAENRLKEIQRQERIEWEKYVQGQS